MPGESEANSSNVINSEDVSEADQEVIAQSLRLLLAQLAGQETDSPLPFPTTFEALDALTTVCKEIEAGADQLVAEHSQKRNQFLSIHQLPPEILVMFISAALSSEEYSRKSHTTTYLHRQKELRLVCARWNELIKATPMLWAIVTCADVYQNRLQMAIRLSETTALNITCCAKKLKPRCRSFAAEMGKLVHRWGSLGARGSLWVDNPISLASELLVLRLYGSTDLFSMPPQPCDFLGGAVSKLREIRLDDFMVPWEWPSLPSLTHLELRKIRQGPTAAQVLDIISRVPRLKSCILHQVRIQPLAEAASEGAPIEATQLRHVQFDSVRLDSVVQILKNLRLSRGCAIEVVAKNHDSSFRPFLDYVRRRLPEIEDPTRKWTTSVSVDITLSPEIILAFPHHEWEMRFILFDQRWDDDGVKWQAYRHVLEEARSGFLHVDGDPGINLWTMFRSISDTLMRIHEVYPNLVYLCTVTEEDTLPSLSRPQYLKSNGTRTQRTDADTDQDTPRQWIFPNLQKLHLCSQPYQPSLNGILGFVEARMNNPEVKPITSLVVDNSEAPEDLRKKLKELVAYVDFRTI